MGGRFKFFLGFSDWIPGAVSDWVRDLGNGKVFKIRKLAGSGRIARHDIPHACKRIFDKGFPVLPEMSDSIMNFLSILAAHLLDDAFCHPDGSATAMFRQPDCLQNRSAESDWRRAGWRLNETQVLFSLTDPDIQAKFIEPALSQLPFHR